MPSLSEILSGAPQKRRVFFSFHYEKDIWRVNQIRNSWRSWAPSDRESHGFFDGSLWERSKRTVDDSLKELIRQGVENTSVTCVLAGSETYMRTWVRYEIVRSVIKHNGLITVNLGGMKDQQGRVNPNEIDPLDFIGVFTAPGHGIFFAEKGLFGDWKPYSKYIRSVTLPKPWPTPPENRVRPLSWYCREYNYTKGNGYLNFSNWVQMAAQDVRR